MGLGEYPAATIRLEAGCKIGRAREIRYRVRLWLDIDVRLRLTASTKPVEAIMEAAMKVRPKL